MIDLSRGDMYRDIRAWKLWGRDFGGLPEGWTTTPPEEVWIQVWVQVVEF